MISTINPAYDVGHVLGENDEAKDMLESKHGYH